MKHSLKTIAAATTLGLALAGTTWADGAPSAGQRVGPAESGPVDRVSGQNDRNAPARSVMDAPKHETTPNISAPAKESGPRVQSEGTNPPRVISREAPATDQSSAGSGMNSQSSCDQMTGDQRERCLRLPTPAGRSQSR